MVKSKLEEFIDMDTAQVDFGKISDGTDFRYVFSIKGVNDRSMRLKTDHPRVQQTLHSLGGVVVIDFVNIDKKLCCQPSNFFDASLYLSL